MNRGQSIGRSVRACVAVAAFALVAGSISAADRKGSPGKPIVFQTQVVNVPSATGLPPGLVAQALRAEAGSKDLRRMSADEAREVGSRLERAFRLNRSSEGLQVKQVGNGLVAMNLEGRYLHIYIGRKEADGSISTACVTDWASAEAFLRGDARGASKPVKE